MVLGRRGFGTLFLTVAGILFCLLTLSATSSEAQERTEARNGGTAPVTEDDECVELQDGNTGTGTGGDTGTDTDGNNTTTDTGEDTTDAGGDTGNRRVQQNENPADRQAQQNENGGNGGDPQASQDGQDNTTSPGTEGTGGEECIIEDTVPDKSLPPTGVPVKPQAETTAAEKEQKRSDRSGNPESQGEKQQKSDQGSKKPENSSEEQRKPDRGVKKLEIKDRGKQIEIEDRSGKKPRQERLGTHSKSASTPDPAPKLAASWPRPTRTEVASAGKPRRFAPSPGSEMTLSAKALGVYNAPIKSSGRPKDLDNGLIRVPETSLPWDRGAQRNVYVAGHYLGNSGTASRLVFYHLHRLKKNDEIVLKDGRGRPYKYRVSESFAAGPEDSWAMGQVRNRDMLTLQTCIPPDFGKRLIVRADRVR